jgi:hypothetical protein
LDEKQKLIDEHLAIMSAWLDIRNGTDKITDPAVRDKILEAVKKIVTIAMRMSTRITVAESILDGRYDKIADRIENSEVEQAFARTGKSFREVKENMPTNMDEVLDLLNLIK